MVGFGIDMTDSVVVCVTNVVVASVVVRLDVVVGGGGGVAVVVVVVLLGCLLGRHRAPVTGSTVCARRPKRSASRRSAPRWSAE